MLFVALFSASLTAQPIAYPSDEPARGIDVIETSDGGYLAVGHIESSETGMNRVLLLKTKSQGHLEWRRSYLEAGYSQYGWSVAETPDSYMILGFSEKGEVTKGLLMKVRKDGELIWRKELGEEHGQIAWSMVPNDNGLICVGEINSDPDNKQLWLFQTDYDGNVLWERKIDTKGRTERVFYVRKYADSRYVATGITATNEKVDDDVLTIMFDEQGEVLWRNVTSVSPKRDVGHAVKVHENRIFVYGYHQAESGTHQPLIIELDRAGNEVEVITPGVEAHDVRIMNGTLTRQGHVITGYAKRTSQDFYQTCLLACDKQGNLQWMNYYGGDGPNTGYGIKSVGPDGYVITGAQTTESGAPSQLFLMLSE